MSLNHRQKCSCYQVLQHDTLMETLQTTITVLAAPVIGSILENESMETPSM